MDRTLVLIPVLNRPHRVQPLLESLGRNMDVLFLCSPNDKAETDAVHAAGLRGMFPLPVVVDWEPGPGDYARKINAGVAAAAARGVDWVFTGADDLRFWPGWLDECLKVARGTGAKVIGTDDLWNPLVRARRHSTHSLVSVEYVMTVGASWDGPGVLYHEGYDHQCVDNELVQVARERGVWAFAERAKVEHLHPMAHKAEKDATYEKALARGRQDVALFRNRAMRNRRARRG